MIQNGIENVPKIGLEVDFWTHRGLKNLREHIFYQKLTFLRRIIPNRSDNPTLIQPIESI